MCVCVSVCGVVQMSQRAHMCVGKSKFVRSGCKRAGGECTRGVEIRKRPRSPKTLYGANHWPSMQITISPCMSREIQEVHRPRLEEHEPQGRTKCKLHPHTHIRTHPQGQTRRSPWLRVSLCYEIRSQCVLERRCLGVRALCVQAFSFSKYVLFSLSSFASPLPNLIITCTRLCILTAKVFAYRRLLSPPYKTARLYFLWFLINVP